MNRRVVIALGRIAFHAFLKAWREDGEELTGAKMEFRHGEEWTLQGGMKLIASYHPSRQNTQTGKLTHPMFDDIFSRAREILAGKRS
jgi:uracil-DNA glycosylase